MKKRQGLKRAVTPIPKSELELLPTGALLARLERLRRCEEDRKHSDLTDGEIATVSDLILFKADEKWRVAYAELREVLSGREHLAK